MDIKPISGAVRLSFERPRYEDGVTKGPEDLAYCKVENETTHLYPFADNSGRMAPKYTCEYLNASDAVFPPAETGEMRFELKNHFAVASRRQDPNRSTLLSVHILFLRRVRNAYYQD